MKLRLVHNLVVVVSHFSKSISQTTTVWELGSGVFGIRVMPRGKLGFYGRSMVLEKWSWRSGTQPLVAKVRHTPQYTPLPLTWPAVTHQSTCLLTLLLHLRSISTCYQLLALTISTVKHHYSNFDHLKKCDAL